MRVDLNFKDLVGPDDDTVIPPSKIVLIWATYSLLCDRYEDSLTS